MQCHKSVLTFAVGQDSFALQSSERFREGSQIKGPLEVKRPDMDNSANAAFVLYLFLGISLFQVPPSP